MDRLKTKVHADKAIARGYSLEYLNGYYVFKSLEEQGIRKFFLFCIPKRLVLANQSMRVNVLLEHQEKR